MELTDNILWLLKQAFHFSLRTVNDAISLRTLDRFNAKTPTKNKGLAEARPSSYTSGSKLLRT